MKVDDRRIIIEKSFEEIGLSEKAYYFLNKAGITTLSQFMSLTWDDLEDIKGIGMSTQIEIMSVQARIKKGKAVSNSSKQAAKKSGTRTKTTIVRELEDLDLPETVCSVLKSNGIDSIDKYMYLNWDSLEKIKGIGMSSQIEIMAIKRKILDKKIIIAEKTSDREVEPVSTASGDNNSECIIDENKCEDKLEDHQDQKFQTSDPIKDLIDFVDNHEKYLNKKALFYPGQRLETLKRIIREGKVDNTYKMALAKAVAELCAKGSESDSFVYLKLDDVAERFLNYYWDQTIFFDYEQSTNHYKTPKIVQCVKALIREYESASVNVIPRKYTDVKDELENGPNYSYGKTLKELSNIITKDVAWRFTKLDDRQADEIFLFDKETKSFKLDKEMALEIETNSDELIKLAEQRWKELLKLYNPDLKFWEMIPVNETEISEIVKKGSEKNANINFTAKDHVPVNGGDSQNEEPGHKNVINLRSAKERVKDFFEKYGFAERGFVLDENSRVIEKNGIKLSSSDGITYLVRFNSSHISSQGQFDYIDKEYEITVYCFDAPYSDNIKWNVSNCRKVPVYNGSDKGYFVCKSLNEDRAAKLLNYFASLDSDIESLKEERNDLTEPNSTSIVAEKSESKIEDKEVSPEEIKETSDEEAEVSSKPETVELTETEALTPAAEIIKYNPLKPIVKGKDYYPALIVINKKMYKVDNWHDALKILMYFHCYKAGKLSTIESFADRTDKTKYSGYLHSDKWAEENQFFAKFSPNMYIRVVQNDASNYETLDKIHHWIGDFDCYVIRKNKGWSELDCSELVEQKIKDLKEKTNYKNGSIKRLLASINARVLNDKEKLFLKIERKFDKVVFIGDIEIAPEEEKYLKEYMNKMLKYVQKNERVNEHEKVFAFGMVRAALKRYKSNTFWPYVKEEYGVQIPGNYQSTVNKCFKNILTKYNKLYLDEGSNYLQNMCMHAFVCDECADQLFDYIFEFWRIDLSRSIENMTGEDGSSLFDVLLDEIESNEEVSRQDVMSHTTMALKMNRRGCQTRFRNILKMIDRAYWNNANYSGSKNRISVLFTKWVNNKKSLFYKEFKNSFERRRVGRGEKLLSKPLILFEQNSSNFKLFMPKQILRRCGTDEHPKWRITIDRTVVREFEPELVQGKVSLYTNECAIRLDGKDLYKRIDLSLYSERANYYKWTISSSDCRFFNAKGRCIEHGYDYISKEACIAFVKKEYQLRYLNGSFKEQEIINDISCVYAFDANDGDIFILPNNHALPVGRQLDEGIVGNSRVEGVSAVFENEHYQITSHREKVFFKASKKQLNGASIKLYKNNSEVYFGKLISKDYIEFLLDESIDDVYGYFIDLKDYVNENGLYHLELSIPNSKTIRSSACYIENFDFRFDNAPYLFEEAGTICFSKESGIVTNKEWESVKNEKRLSFIFEENESNNYVRNRALILKHHLNQNDVSLEFRLPILYWRYSLMDDWEFSKPNDIDFKDIPSRIFITSGIDLSEAKLHIENDDDLEESEFKVSHDENGYYFRMTDVISNINREKESRTLNIVIAGKEMEFFKIVCKSRVESKNITGDFKTNKIYGNYDIIGSSDYSVNIYFEEEMIEEEVPVIDGKFEIECNVKEGKYRIELYEIEEDDSGFDSTLILLDKEELELVDPYNLERKTLRIRRIKYGGSKFAPIQLANIYWIVSLHKLNYQKDILEKIEFDIWTYDTEDTETLSQFTYYEGMITYETENGLKELGKGLIIFDNAMNAGNVIVEVFDDEGYKTLIYSSTKRKLLKSSNELTSYERKKAKSLDDDKYRFEIEIGWRK